MVRLNAARSDESRSMFAKSLTHKAKCCCPARGQEMLHDASGAYAKDDFQVVENQLARQRLLSVHPKDLVL
jgi:hypothetical protein